MRGGALLAIFLVMAAIIIVIPVSANNKNLDIIYADNQLGDYFLTDDIVLK